MEELAERFPFADTLTAVEVDRSLDDLRSAQDRRVDVRSASRSGRADSAPASIAATRGVFDVGIDVPANALTVSIGPDAPPAFDGDVARAARVPVHVERAGAATEARCLTQNDCGTVMLVGLRITPTTSNAQWCSSGFIAGSGSTRFMLSAGHCYNHATGARPFWHHGGRYFGGVTAWAQSGTADVMRVRSESNFDLATKVYQPGADAWMLTSYMGWSNFFTGQFMTKVGVTTGRTSGTVTDVDVRPSYVSNPSRFVRATMCSDGGDSGGAVYANRAGTGILSGRYPGQACNGFAGSNGGPTIFGAVDYAASRMGVTLLTYLNVAPTANFSSSCTLLGSCTFTAAGSQDPDGSIVAYTWNFGDGSTGSGYQVTHQYLSTGAKSVRLTVRDDDGTSRSRTRTVQPLPI